MVESDNVIIDDNTARAFSNNKIDNKIDIIDDDFDDQPIDDHTYSS